MISPSFHRPLATLARKKAVVNLVKKAKVLVKMEKAEVDSVMTLIERDLEIAPARAPR